MHGIRGLMLLGVPLGGSRLLPFVDNFDRADGDLGNGWIYTPGVWAIASGALTSTPTLGAELVVNGNMETGDPPTGYNALHGATLSAAAEERTGGSGSKSLQITRGTQNDAAAKPTTIAAKQFYRTGVWARRGTGTAAGAQGGFMWFVNLTSDWKYLPGFGYSNNTSWTSSFSSYNALGLTTLWDDLSLKQVMRADLFCVQDFGTPNVRFAVNLTGLQTYPAGIVLAADSASNPQSFVLGIIAPYNNTGTVVPRLYILKFVNGTMTELGMDISLGTYVDGGTLELEYAAGVFRIFYGGEQRGIDYSASDVEILSNTLHGLWNTDSSNTFDSVAVKTAPTCALDGSPSAIFSIVTAAANLWSTSGTDDWLGRPALADCGDHWIATYISGTDHTTAANIHCRFTADEAATWTEEDTFLDGAAVTVPGHMPTVAPDGSLLTFMKDDEGATCFRSTDGGKTWSAAIRQVANAGCITDETFVYGTRVYACVIDWTNQEWATLHLYISDNNGLAWSKLADMPTNEAGDEWSVISLDGINFLAVKRDFDRTNTLYSLSSDGGATWTDWAVYANLGVVQKPTLRALAGGIMMVGRDGGFNIVAHSAGVWYSADAGLTWCRHFHPDATVFGDAGYCAVLEKTDGNFYLLSYGGTIGVAAIRRMVFGIT